MLKQCWRVAGCEFLFSGILIVLVRTKSFQLYLNSVGKKNQVPYKDKKITLSAVPEIILRTLPAAVNQTCNPQESPSKRLSSCFPNKKARKRMKKKNKWKTCSLIWVHQKEQGRLHKVGTNSFETFDTHLLKQMEFFFSFRTCFAVIFLLIKTIGASPHILSLSGFLLPLYSFKIVLQGICSD